MATSQSSSAGADEMNVKLLELLEQLVASQTIKATAELQEGIAERLAAAHRPYEGIGLSKATDDQAQLVMRFEALRNGLGNLSRLSARDVVLMKAPTLYRDGVLVFVDPLPDIAETARIFGPDAKQIRRYNGVGGAFGIENVDLAMAYLQVDDHHGTPILIGVPVRTDATTQAPAATEELS